MGIVLGPLVAAMLQLGGVLVQVAEACLGLVDPQESELIITRLDERVKDIMNLSGEGGVKGKEGVLTRVASLRSYREKLSVA